MALAISTSTDQGNAVVSVTGEVDVSNAAELRAALDACLSESPAEVVVDLSGVPYIDSTGIGVLVGAAHRAAEAGARITVARPQRNVLRVLGLLGVGADLNIQES